MPPFPKTCPKTVFAPKKGVAFLWKASLQKNNQVRGEDCAVDAYVRLQTRACAKALRSRQPHSSLIGGLLGVEASGICSKAFLGTKAKVRARH